MRVGVRSIWELSALSTQFSCERKKLLKNKVHFYTLKNTFTALYEVVKKFKLFGGRKSVMKSLVFNTKMQVWPKIGTL